MYLTRLDLHSEPYGSTGNIGENFRRVLGAPTLDPLQTLVREAVQNIADAAKLGAGPRIFIRLRTLCKSQLLALREYVLADNLPEESTYSRRIQVFLDSDSPVVMEICDYNTTGLGGPTRADKIPAGTRTTDFIDFVQNIGTPRDSKHGGGTYGFGKVALYKSSYSSTILIDSQVAGGGIGSRRLIGCHVGESFQQSENGMLRRFTGRHWWGKKSDCETYVEPATDYEASCLSSALGMPSRTDKQSGTSIMILDFDLAGEDIGVTGRRIAESILWNFWPRMTRDASSAKKFEIRLEVEGDPIDIPRPEDFPPLDLFATALQRARAGGGPGVEQIVSKRPRKRLGSLAIVRGVRANRRLLISGDSLIPSISHHVALMRPVELVVKYLAGEAFPDELAEWAGVFIASSEDEVERAFADSEPPAHDDWISANLPKGPAKTFVNVAMRDITKRSRQIGRFAVISAIDDPNGPPITRAASLLGRFLTRDTKSEASFDPNGRRRSSRNSPTVSRPVFVRLEYDGGNPVAVFETVVGQDKTRSGFKLQVTANAVIDGSPARKISESTDSPAVKSIQGLDTNLRADGECLEIAGREGRFEIRIPCSPDFAVSASAKVLKSGKK